MKAALKNLAREAVLRVPFARERYFQREFLKRSPSCMGAYSSFEEAGAHAPPAKLFGYNHPSIPEFYKASVDELNPGDYPVLFWLLRLLAETRYVFELGGSVGKGFYAYARYLPFPADLRWVICETPETVKLGREVAAGRKETRLNFTDDRANAGEPDVYATFGTLQYIEEPLASILGKLARRPPHVLVGRVPFVEKGSYVTLQNNGGWFSPYAIQNRPEFVASMEKLGYEVADKWETFHPNSFLLAPEVPVPRYHGIYFRLR